DSNFAFWHSATFNNDGTKVLFTDEWGGGLQPKCRATDRPEWGADAIFSVTGNAMTFRSYYKIPAPQTSFENCVAHNGSLVPVPAGFVVARAYLDQLARSNGLTPDRVAAARGALARAERLSGQPRRDALTQLAAQLSSDSKGAPRLVVDGKPVDLQAGEDAKVRTLAGMVTDLANAGR